MKLKANCEIAYELALRGANAAREHIAHGGRSFILHPSKSNFGVGFNSVMRPRVDYLNFIKAKYERN